MKNAEPDPDINQDDGTKAEQAKSVDSKQRGRFGHYRAARDAAREAQGANPCPCCWQPMPTVSMVFCVQCWRALPESIRKTIKGCASEVMRNKLSTLHMAIYGLSLDLATAWLCVNNRGNQDADL